MHTSSRGRFQGAAAPAAPGVEMRSTRAADEIPVLDSERLATLDPDAFRHAYASIGQGQPRVVGARRDAGHAHTLVVVDGAVGIVRALVGAEGGGAGGRELERFDG